MKYGLEFAGAPRRVRRNWGGTVLTVLTLLAMAALCGWLLHVLRGTAQGTVRTTLEGPTALVAQQQGYFLAMAPVPTKGDGAVLVAVLLGMAGVIWLSVLAERKLEAMEAMERRKLETRLTEIDQETEERWRRVRRKQREILQRHACETVPRESWTVGPLESLSEAVEEEETLRGGDLEPLSQGNDDFQISESHSLPVSQSLGLPVEDLRRIVGALRAEVRSARDLVMLADGTWCDEEAKDYALAALHQCVGCVDGLAVAVGCERKDEGSKMKDERGAA